MVWLSFVGSLLDQGVGLTSLELGFSVLIAFSCKLGHGSKHYPSKYKPN